MGTTGVGLVLAAISLAVVAGGCGLIRHADALPAPLEPAHRRLPGTVLESGAAGACGPASRPRGTCYQPVVGYEDAGRSHRFRTRARYSPAPHRAGEPVTVVVGADGAAWLEREWRDEQARRQDAYDAARGTPLVMGRLLAGSGAFGLLLALGLIFWVDRSGPEPPR